MVVMLLTAAVTGIVTLLVTLSMLFITLNNKMLLVEGYSLLYSTSIMIQYHLILLTDSSKVNDITTMVPYYSGKLWYHLAFTLKSVYDTIRVHQTQVMDGIGVVKEMTANFFTHLRVVETLQQIHNFTGSSIYGMVNIFNTVTVYIESPFSILGIDGKWIFSIIFGVSYLVNVDLANLCHFLSFSCAFYLSY